VIKCFIGQYVYGLSLYFFLKEKKIPNVVLIFSCTSEEKLVSHRGFSAARAAGETGVPVVPRVRRCKKYIFFLWASPPWTAVLVAPKFTHFL
jgi:hypothetical protein